MELSTSDQLAEVRRRPTQQRSRERFDALVEAAGKLIGERGLEPVSITDIANEADVALTAAYRYFPNKQAIVRELAFRSFEITDELSLQLSTRGNRSLQRWIEDSVRTYVTANLDDSTRLQIRAAIHADLELSALNFRDSLATAEQVATALVDEGVNTDPGELKQRALLLLKLFDGAIGLARTVPPEETDGVINRFAKLASNLLLGDV